MNFFGRQFFHGDEHADVFFRAVVLVFGQGGDLVDHFEAFDHFAEHGVFTVEVRRAAYGGISFEFLGGDFLFGLDPCRCFHDGFYFFEIRFISSAVVGLHEFG